MTASAMARPIAPRSKIRLRWRLLVALRTSEVTGGRAAVSVCRILAGLVAAKSGGGSWKGGSSDPHDVQNVSDGAGITRHAGHARHCSIGMISVTRAVDPASGESGSGHATASAVLTFLLNITTPSAAACDYPHNLTPLNQRQ